MKKYALFLLGMREFLSENQIIAYIQVAPYLDSAKEHIEKAQSLLIFQTSKQKTWLVSTKEWLYCILDDIRKENPSIRWSIGKDDLTSGNEIKIIIQTHEKSDDVGLVDIGPKTGWLYSKDLFVNISIKHSIENLIKSTML